MKNKFVLISEKKTVYNTCILPSFTHLRQQNLATNTVNWAQTKCMPKKNRNRYVGTKDGRQMKKLQEVGTSPK